MNNAGEEAALPPQVSPDLLARSDQEWEPQVPREGRWLPEECKVIRGHDGWTEHLILPSGAQEHLSQLCCSQASSAEQSSPIHFEDGSPSLCDPACWFCLTYHAGLLQTGSLDHLLVEPPHKLVLLLDLANVSSVFRSQMALLKCLFSDPTPKSRCSHL